MMRSISLLLALLMLLPSLAAAELIDGQAAFKSWSGYWWSFNGGALSNGYSRWTDEPAPIEKYELYVNGAYPGDATRWEDTYHYDPAAPNWFGLCHAWAAAATVENIPFVPSVIGGVLFRIGDKKGLITLAHDNDVNLAVRGTNSPVDFHVFLLKYLHENRRAFVADLGGADETWFYPIYRFSMDITSGSGYKDVKCYIWYADDRVDADFCGTVEMPSYFEYRLTVNSAGEITGGSWQGNSVYQHPKSLFYPLETASTNPYIDYETIKSIALSRDDELESDNPVRLPEGEQVLISLNDDAYYVDCAAGDLLSLDFDRIDADDPYSHIVVTAPDGKVVLDEYLREKLSLRYTAAVAGRYVVSITRTSYDKAGICRVTCAVRSNRDRCQPSLRSGSAWNGFALTNTGTTAVENVAVVACNSDGTPQRTLLSPRTWQPGERYLATLSMFPLPLHVKNAARALKITNGAALQQVYIGGEWGKNMSGFGSNDPGAAALVIPDTSSMYDAGKAVDFGVVNISSGSHDVIFDLYNAAGESVGTRTVSVPPYTTVQYGEGNNPFHTNIDNAWYLIHTDAPVLRGYINWRYGGTKYESLAALGDSATSLIMPHVAVDSSWNTKVTVINPAAVSTTVTFNLLTGGVYASEQLQLAPHEKRTLLLGGDIFTAVSRPVLGTTALAVQATEPVCGYVSYETAEGLTRVPLLAPRLHASVLTVPHIASDSYWWTGVALCNPGQGAVDVTIIAYDDSGEPIAGGVVQRRIERQSKDVFAVRSLFPAMVLDKTPAWLRIESSGVIAGLVLYGGVDNNVVTGCPLTAP